MEMREYAVMLKRLWAWPLGALFLTLNIALLYLSVTPTTYTARSELFLSATSTQGEPLLDLSSYSQQRAKSYAESVQTPAVLQPVIDSLGLDTSSESLGQSITASVPVETVVLQLDVTRDNSDEAVSIAEELTESTVSLIDQLEGSGSLEVVVLTNAVLDPSATTPNRILILAAAAVIGLVIGLALALWRHLSDPILRSSADVRLALAEAVRSTAPFNVEREQDVASRVSLIHAAALGTFLCARPDPQSSSRHVALPSRSCLVCVVHDGHAQRVAEACVTVAQSLADEGSRVCVVDEDVLHQPLSTLAGAASSPGLAEFVSGTVAFDHIKHPQARSHLTFVFSGTAVDDFPQGAPPGVRDELVADFDWTFVLGQQAKVRESNSLLMRHADVVIVWVTNGTSRKDELMDEIDMALAVHRAEIVVVIDHA